jgi:hypothetical protein
MAGWRRRQAMRETTLVRLAEAPDGTRLAWFNHAGM